MVVKCMVQNNSNFFELFNIEAGFKQFIWCNWGSQTYSKYQCRLNLHQPCLQGHWVYGVPLWELGFRRAVTVQCWLSWLEDGLGAPAQPVFDKRSERKPAAFACCVSGGMSVCICKVCSKKHRMGPRGVGQCLPTVPKCKYLLSKVTAVQKLRWLLLHLCFGRVGMLSMKYLPARWQRGRNMWYIFTEVMICWILLEE